MSTEARLEPAPKSDGDDVAAPGMARRRESPVPTLRVRFRSWRQRGLARRVLVSTHRWSALLLGVFLVAQTTSGAVLLYHADLFRAANTTFYEHADSRREISPQQAIAAVSAVHPDFSPSWVSRDRGILAVGNSERTFVYAVDPGTGKVNGGLRLDEGFLSWLANMHRCAFTCPEYAGYVPLLAKPVPSVGFEWPKGTNWGRLIIIVLAVLLLMLTIIGAFTSSLALRRALRGLRTRARKNRFARDYHLHQVIGIVAVPFLLLWAFTGTEFFLPAVEKAWLTVTGGHQQSKDVAFPASPVPAGTPDIGVDKAVAAALRATAGEFRYVLVPDRNANYYQVFLASSYASRGERLFFSGDRLVYVDQHDPTHVMTRLDDEQPVANAVYYKVLEQAHFGWAVNGWWRTIWLAFGVVPLGLMITGGSTWLVRRRLLRRKRRAGRPDVVTE
ncbi:MAG: PepSY domain-containing protein [Kutzneria sp.]|nr:PepSY domain-containing protein [Kutzneria sp.]MBV9848011.1 PepSY domain-containing protein [Kutzneria sp.]